MRDIEIVQAKSPENQEVPIQVQIIPEEPYEPEYRWPEVYRRGGWRPMRPIENGAYWASKDPHVQDGDHSIGNR